MPKQARLASCSSLRERSTVILASARIAQGIIRTLNANCAAAKSARQAPEAVFILHPLPLSSQSQGHCTTIARLYPHTRHTTLTHTTISHTQPLFIFIIPITHAPHQNPFHPHLCRFQGGQGDQGRTAGKAALFGLARGLGKASKSIVSYALMRVDRRVGISIDILFYSCDSWTAPCSIFFFYLTMPWAFLLSTKALSTCFVLILPPLTTFESQFSFKQGPFLDFILLLMPNRRSPTIAFYTLTPFNLPRQTS